jgi:hypothetical protein
MGDYQALVAYFGVAFIVFLGGILWSKRRATIMRRLRIREYRHTGDGTAPPTVRASH